MSGTKRGIIIPSQRETLSLQCRRAKQWLESAEQRPSFAELQIELKEARAAARKLTASQASTGTPQPPPALLDGFEKVRGELGLLLQRQQVQWSAADDALASLRSQLKQGEVHQRDQSSQDDMKSATDGLYLAMKRAAATLAAIRPQATKVANLRRQLQLWNTHIIQLVAVPLQASAAQPAAQPAALTPADLSAVQLRIERQAATTAIRERLDTLINTAVADRAAVAGRLLKPARWDDYADLLKGAEMALAEEGWDRAQAVVDTAYTLRTALLQEALETAAAVERNQQIAEAIMEALCARNYNVPKYGELNAGDPFSGVQIRADVPGTDGKGNVRVDLHFDGLAVFNLENVSKGEENLCREVLGDVDDTLSALGMELRMEAAWARKPGPQFGGDDTRQTIVLREPEREPQRERGA